MEEKLFDTLIQTTGLPPEMITQEFLQKIQDKGFDKATLTLEQIRIVLAEYLQDVILQAKDDFK